MYKFVFGSYNEVDMLFANTRDLFPPSDGNLIVSMKSSMHIMIWSKKI